MAAITASDVTYTVKSQRYAGLDGITTEVKLTFGGSVSYAAGGVPLTKGKMGCPNFLNNVRIVEDSAAVTTFWKYDDSAEKLVAYTLDDSEAEHAASTLAAQEVHLSVTGY